jgi:hypothetical protein
LQIPNIDPALFSRSMSMPAISVEKQEEGSINTKSSEFGEMSSEFIAKGKTNDSELNPKGFYGF